MEIIDACATPENWLSSWQALSAIGILISYFIIAILYMFGTYIGNPSVVARAKNDIYQVIATTLMFASLIFFVSFICTADMSNFGLSSGTIFSIAQKYLENLRNNIMNLMSGILMVSWLLQVLVSIYGAGGWMGIQVFAQPFAGAHPVVAALNLIMNLSLFTLIATIAQLTVLKMIQAGIFNILLPVGLICRSFPLTREFGGAIMGIAIGLFVFYPFMYVVNDVVVDKESVEGDMNTVKILTTALTIRITIMTGTTSHIAFIPMLSYYPIFSLSFMGIFILVLNAFAEIMLAGFFLPALNGIIWVAVTRDLSRALGQEVDITRLTRMI